MNQMEVIDRAERLARLQAYGTERAASTGVSYEERSRWSGGCSPRDRDRPSPGDGRRQRLHRRSRRGQ